MVETTIGCNYSKLSIKRPGLNFSKKSLLNDQVHLKKSDRPVLFQGCHGQFLGSIKRPGLDI